MSIHTPAPSQALMTGRYLNVERLEYSLLKGPVPNQQRPLPWLLLPSLRHHAAKDQAAQMPLRRQRTNRCRARFMNNRQIGSLDSCDHVSCMVDPGGAVKSSCVLIPVFPIALEGVCPPSTLCHPFLGNRIKLNIEYPIPASIFSSDIDVEWHGGQL